MTRLVIIGAGGHAKIIADMVRLNEIELAGFIDNGPSAYGLTPVLGDDDWLEHNAKSDGITHFIIGMGSVRGGAPLRRKLFERHSAYLSAMTLIHPKAIIAKDVKIGDGTAVMAGAIINPGTRIGKNAIINTGAIIEHDISIADDAHIAPGCTLSGEVSIGENSLIGTASAVRQGISVGKNVTLGAGSTLVSDLADGVTAWGNPARTQS